MTPSEFTDWQQRRQQALAAPDGWLNIISRDDLPAGPASFGSAPDNDIVLPTGPAHIGSLIPTDAATLTFQPADNGPAQVLALSKAAPPRFTVGTLLLEVTTLNGVSALRVRDTASTAAASLPPLRYFPHDPSWRITARWEALPTPKGLTIDTSKSIATTVEATHQAVFTREGHRVELLATHGTPAVPQFVFRDLTARDDTYPACRFVYGEALTATTIVLDFNTAINPPCAFTPFAVCPLPPPQNVLPLRIEAGERRLSS